VSNQVLRDNTGAETDRGEVRRQQILDAAAVCFRHHGFHGASMAVISKTAGMSVGHIYHYFENKEAIIAAIVQQDVQDLMTLFEEIGQSDDILEAMTGRADHGFDTHVDGDFAALALEIAAEAARNPKVAAIVQAAEQTKRRVVMDILRKGIVARGRSMSDAEIETRLDGVAAMFEGFSMRIVRNPSLDRDAALRTLRSVMRFLFES
jgi:AcrR family transcriptional regulator